MVTLGEDSKAALTAANAGRADAFYQWSQGSLDSVQGDIDVQMGKVNDWFGERLAWVEGLYDTDYKQSIIGQLEDKRDLALAGLQERRDTIQGAMDGWRDSLAQSNADSENALWNFHSNTLDSFDADTTANFNDFTDSMESLFNDFSYGVEDNLQAKEDYAQATIGDWAQWIEY